MLALMSLLKRRKTEKMENLIYTDLFIDFDDTLYDTHGNAQIALEELFEQCNFGQWFTDPQLF